MDAATKQILDLLPNDSIVQYLLNRFDHGLEGCIVGYLTESDALLSKEDKSAYVFSGAGVFPVQLGLATMISDSIKDQIREH